MPRDCLQCVGVPESLSLSHTQQWKEPRVLHAFVRIQLQTNARKYSNCCCSIDLVKCSVLNKTWMCELLECPLAHPLSI